MLRSADLKGRQQKEWGQRDGDVSFIAELVLDQKSGNQNCGVGLYYAVCSRDDAKLSSGYSEAKAHQGAIPVCLTTAGHIYHSAGLCNHRNIILHSYCISIKIHIFQG